MNPETPDIQALIMQAYESTTQALALAKSEAVAALLVEARMHLGDAWSVMMGGHPIRKESK